MEKPVNYLEELSKELGITPTREQIFNYNKFVIDIIPSKYIAFDTREDIVAHGDSLDKVEEHSVAKGILSHYILFKSVIDPNKFESPIGFYPYTDAFDRQVIKPVEFKKNMVEKVMFL